MKTKANLIEALSLLGEGPHYVVIEPGLTYLRWFDVVSYQYLRKAHKDCGDDSFDYLKVSRAHRRQAYQTHWNIERHPAQDINK